VRIGIIPTLARGLLPRAIARLATQAPELDLRITQVEPEDSLPALERGEFDVAVAGEYALKPSRLEGSIERIDLFTESVLVAVAADDPLPGPQVRMADLREVRWIAPAAGSSCGVMLERASAVAGYEPHVVAHCAEFAVATALVAAGHGVALIPRIAADSGGLPPVRLLEVTHPQIQRTLFAAVRLGGRHHRAISCVVDALAASVPPA